MVVETKVKIALKKTCHTRIKWLNLTIILISGPTILQITPNSNGCRGATRAKITINHQWSPNQINLKIINTACLIIRWEFCVITVEQWKIKENIHLNKVKLSHF